MHIAKVASYIAIVLTSAAFLVTVAVAVIISLVATLLFIDDG